MIISVGEILADLIGKAEGDRFVYARHAGGAPFNVACGVLAAGGKSGFIGRVGNDVIGRYLREYAAGCGFAFLRIEADENRNTTLAFVDIDESGERSFCFARKNTADYCIEDDFCDSFSSANIVHIGSLMLSQPEGRAVADRAFAAARKQNKKISFDVNFRDDLFDTSEASRKLFLHYIDRADIVKVSEDELCFLCRNSGEKSGRWFVEPLKTLCGDSHKIVALTMGGNGCAVCRGGKVYLAEAMRLTPVDTTGAGDAFYATFLAGLDSEALTECDILQAAKLANVAAGYTTLGHGAIVPLPPIDAMRAEAAKLKGKALA